MSSSWRIILTCGAIAALVCFGVIGWVVYNNTEGSATSLPLEQLDQLPATPQSSTTGSQSSTTGTSSSAASVPETTATDLSSASPNETTELETVGRAIDAYKSEYQKYPDSIAVLQTADADLAIPTSYTYYADSPKDDLYSLCTLSEDSQEYECVSSEFGSDDPFSFPSAAVETSDFSSWQPFTWESATSGEDDLLIATPPDWTYATSSYSLVLLATDARGSNITISEISFSNFQMRPSETFSEFEQENVAQETVDFATSTQLMQNGFPAYQLAGTDKEWLGGSGLIETYAFWELLIQQTPYVFELDVEIDSPVLHYFNPALGYILGSVKAIPPRP